jgi:intracellular septation protein A
MAEPSALTAEPSALTAEPSALMADPLSLPAPIAVGSILRQSAPRVVLSGFGPLAAFYVGWKLAGLLVGIAAAAGFGLFMYRHERRAGRPAMIVRVALGLVVIRTGVGLITHSTNLYLGQEIIIDTILGSVVLGSLQMRRPLAAMFAREVYPFPDEIRDSASFRRIFVVITVVWGAYFLVRACVRLVALLALSTDGYLLVAALSDAPFLLALLGWSVVYSTRRFRASREWAQAILAAERAPQADPAGL